MHYDSLDTRHVFGTPLCQHAKVGAPVTRVRESGGVGCRIMASNECVNYTIFLQKYIKMTVRSD